MSVKHFTAKCPPNVPCNPPAPRQVECPPDVPKDTKGKAVAGNASKQDGECTFYFKAKCAPTEKCNPPPPRKIKCW